MGSNLSQEGTSAKEAMHEMVKAIRAQNTATSSNDIDQSLFKLFVKNRVFRQYDPSNSKFKKKWYEKFEHSTGLIMTENVLNAIDALDLRVSDSSASDDTAGNYRFELFSLLLDYFYLSRPVDQTQWTSEMPDENLLQLHVLPFGKINGICFYLAAVFLQEKLKKNQKWKWLPEWNLQTFKTRVGPSFDTLEETFCAWNWWTESKTGSANVGKGHEWLCFKIAKDTNYVNKLDPVKKQLNQQFFSALKAKENPDQPPQVHLITNRCSETLMLHLNMNAERLQDFKLVSPSNPSGHPTDFHIFNSVTDASARNGSDFKQWRQQNEGKASTPLDPRQLGKAFAVQNIPVYFLKRSCLSCSLNEW
eukprot:CAMPEP_0175093462 /NCGR_PEP_ID=MMETSP0086_2-20121207/3032_1 /TAXON_ID=136419 /ORGANISM="Unknown Unknown, Strain D1" /LENGTH=361 /DNA_ID=CAMNT_0016366439 /DNA_START=55 /DNA_END=1137 /DNA_ORIENTATION=+